MRHRAPEIEVITDLTALPEEILIVDLQSSADKSSARSKACRQVTVPINERGNELVERGRTGDRRGNRHAPKAVEVVWIDVRPQGDVRSLTDERVGDGRGLIEKIGVF